MHLSGPRSRAGRRRRAAVLLLAAAVATAACSKGTESSTTNAERAGRPPGTMADGTPVFPLPEDASGAIKQAGLPELKAEGQVVHHHAHLDLNINDHAVTVPANIGVAFEGKDRSKAVGISPLHTHTDDGIIHVEAENPDTITLGQLFTEWGVKLDKACVATYCTDDTNQFLGYVNGQLVPDPASIPITEHAQIYLWYGPRGTNPKVPATYDFAAKGL